MKKKHEDDPTYIYLENKYLKALEIVHQKEVDQSVDRALLQCVTSELREHEIRKRMAKRRKGHTGLAALNRDIRKYYEYCENKHIYPF